jgi:hypothetical protein
MAVNLWYRERKDLATPQCRAIARNSKAIGLPKAEWFRLGSSLSAISILLASRDIISRGRKDVAPPSPIEAAVREPTVSLVDGNVLLFCMPRTTGGVADSPATHRSRLTIGTQSQENGVGYGYPGRQPTGQAAMNARMV